MNPDDLLDTLTPPTSSADHLVATARRLAHRRQSLRDTLAAAAILTITTTLISQFVSPTFLPNSLPAHLSSTPPLKTPPPLSPDELLDAFGDQPVALVTYPDGRQQLIAILRPAPRTTPPH